MPDLLVVPLAAVLNRVRGGGFGMDRLPGRGCHWASAGLFPVLLLLGTGWLLAAAWAVGFLVWATPAWGRWMDLDRNSPSADPPDLFERVIEWLAERTPLPIARLFGLTFDHAALWLRHLLVLPGLGAVAWVTGLAWLPWATPMFAALVVGAYELARRQTVMRALPLAEYLTGALWGGLILLSL